MTAPYYAEAGVTIFHGDCLDVMRELPDASVDAVVTDPPYGLGFMGRAWDDLPPGREWAAECLRLLKPGGHLLAFGGTRTWHRLATAVEDAGFEIRDSISWLYGSGFPKSLDVSKAIDKAAGAEREVIGTRVKKSGDITGGNFKRTDGYPDTVLEVTAPATDAAEQWQGWGTALKPAHEPIVVARKPLIGTVAGNVAVHGTGALNIDGCRVAHASAADLATSQAKNPGRSDSVTSGVYGADRPQQSVNAAGRWPANVLLDQSQADALDAQTGVTKANGRVGARTGKDAGTFGAFTGQAEAMKDYDDAGGASRFFKVVEPETPGVSVPDPFPTFRYQAKAPKAERPRDGDTVHPTVKPLTLMRWLVRLVTPPGGTVLDPFLGSGTTAEACVLEGFGCIGIEREVDYLPLIVARLDRTHHKERPCPT